MSHTTALIVDDEPDIRELLEITLSRMGLKTHSAANLQDARLLLQKNRFDLCLTDMQLPDGNGIELVKHIQKYCSDTPVAMITAFGSMDTAVDALKAGAFDFVSKPVELNRLRDLVNTALKLNRHTEPSPEQSTPMLGESPRIAKLQAQIRKLARSQAPVYISGESGSGKELVARKIHEQGPRAEAPFIPVNCGAIPSELMESEFFGHTKGSFTGATAAKAGLFQAATGGTLFLDEVADLPLHMQVKLLRAIQEKSVRPVGSEQEIAVDVRILSATHKDLAQLVKEQQFRQDLFYRINVIELKVPSLRERSEDIPLLAQSILRKLAEECDTTPPQLDQEALDALMRYPFPGNVRELENILERAFTLCEEEQIGAEDLQLEPAQPLESENAPLPTLGVDSLEAYMETIERSAITQALEKTRGNKTAAAKQLGISFRALRYRLKKLEME
ncbi:sigma-54-dependent transcriptional regulator [Aestuariirhabdus litorea]|uniref:Sigma-54-dependent Fis family transcriptional regulator n=1 Tax=Aestuariirhabdus litorea TaxID=2528527 RepID=A0A3P3VKJ1_9GAMM|nr:sigma-54 dependent transcriptional regulator [Aestuariirhabdus litorea]RRJ83261.1 sigma-54-dependent Fis family transcriptional regulator [Aestuariirhabdus litorea]RWW93420.1 response regulator [Endozoicomonadaceae bacterium GTF-13]